MSVVPSGGGVLPVDKPAGPTSHDVVTRARRALEVRKIGHSGTLDPFATGLLLLCVGPATRLSAYLTGLDKEYVATARLGVRTDTLDREGEVLGVEEGWEFPARQKLVHALEGFLGRTEQIPPKYSAKKVGGEAAHRRVRRGEAVTLAPVSIEVGEIELLAAEPPDVRFRMRCSSGTYVRALARDFGEALGVGAHLVELRRTRIGPFDVERAVTPDFDPEAVGVAWIRPLDVLQQIPKVKVDEEEAVRLSTGQSVRLAHSPDVPAPTSGAVRSVPGSELVRDGEEPVAVVHGGRLIAVAARRGPFLLPRKVFSVPSRRPGR